MRQSKGINYLIDGNPIDFKIKLCLCSVCIQPLALSLFEALYNKVTFINSLHAIVSYYVPILLVDFGYSYTDRLHIWRE